MLSMMSENEMSFTDSGKVICSEFDERTDKGLEEGLLLVFQGDRKRSSGTNLGPKGRSCNAFLFKPPWNSFENISFLLRPGRNILDLLEARDDDSPVGRSLTVTEKFCVSEKVSLTLDLLKLEFTVFVSSVKLNGCGSIPDMAFQCPTTRVDV